MWNWLLKNGGARLPTSAPGKAAEERYADWFFVSGHSTHPGAEGIWGVSDPVVAEIRQPQAAEVHQREALATIQKR